jgi:hypothetical protein
VSAPDRLRGAGAGIAVLRLGRQWERHDVSQKTGCGLQERDTTSIRRMVPPQSGQMAKSAAVSVFFTDDYCVTAAVAQNSWIDPRRNRRRRCTLDCIARRNDYRLRTWQNEAKFANMFSGSISDGPHSITHGDACFAGRVYACSGAVAFALFMFGRRSHENCD